MTSRAVRSHDASLMDEVRLDLLDPGKHRVEHQEEHHRDDNRDFRLDADAERDDDDRGNCDLRDRAEDQDVRLDNPRQARAKTERKADRAAGDRADDIAEHDLPEGDRGIGPYLAPA